MASFSIRPTLFLLVFSVHVFVICEGSFYYGGDVRSDGRVDELKLLVKRAVPVNNSIKNKSIDGKTGVQKLEKNSASNRESVSSVKKNLPDDPANNEGDELSDKELIKHFVNDTSAEEVTQIKHDFHQYYNSTIVTESNRIDEFWVDLSKMSEHVVIHEMLSKSYRRAATVSLAFDFPFYGHILKNATIATGGFLYLGDYMHSWLASTQYIAPLMANFDTSLNEKSLIKYADNGTDFVVQWEATYLRDHVPAGPFTFQARLRNTGDIVFAYKQIPVTVTSISDLDHPVRVGVSDAYIIDRALLMHKRKIIYEYHRVEISKEKITNLTAVYLTALPSCITLRDCDSCQSSTIGFDCTWCEKAQRCSDGMDRYRHDWLVRGCDNPALEDVVCPVPVTQASINHVDDSVRSFGAAAIIGILFVVALVFGFVSWIIYAYKNPHSASGQIIIKYRPSQWHWNRGEANYTPASVHI